MNKTAIKNYAVWARNKLIADIEYKAGLMGITENGIAAALPQSTSEVQFFDIGTKDYASVRGTEIKQRNALISAIRTKEKDGEYKKAFHFIVEKVAYTWFNRLVAIRFMEVNDYLPSRVRVLSSENENKAEPDMVTRPFDTDMSFTQQEEDLILKLKDDNRLDELFRWLFIKQCHKLHDVLPLLFSPETLNSNQNDYMELLLTISFTDKDGVLWHLVHDIREQDFRIRTPEDDERQRIENIAEEDMPAGQVEIIGWMYQYYNTEPKDQVFADLKKNIKISKDKIPAATQLFTPDWIVRYMVENSLGRLWVEGHPNEELKKNWKYYLEEAEQEPDVQAQLAEIRRGYAALRPEEIKVIDPCMGSGHILVYLFDVLMQIYESQGWTQREAAQSIVQNNLYGLDIDERAAQLAYFAVMMKARQYDRRFLERKIEPHIYEIQESNQIDSNVIEYFANGNKKLKADITALVNELRDAKEYGSILNVTLVDFPTIYRRFEEIKEESHIFNLAAINELLPLMKRAEAMAQKYDVVVTNPPYMGSSGMDSALLKYIKDNYPDSQTDLFSVFIERCILFSKQSCYLSMITMQGWMFLSSFERLRRKILAMDINSLLRIGYNSFPEMNSQVAHACTFVLANRHTSNFCGKFFDLNTGKVTDDKDGVFQMCIRNERFYLRRRDDFLVIPNTPIAIALSNTMISAFNNKKLKDIASPRVGLQTGENNRFLRLWFECSIEDIEFCCTSTKESQAIGKKWFPYNKGGDYRKWYGNNDYVVNWENDGFEIRHFYGSNGKLRSRPQNTDFYFKESVSWSKVSTDTLAFRYKPQGHIFDVAGTSFFAPNNVLMYLHGLCNSCVAMRIIKSISPTLNFEVGHIASLPVVYKTDLEQSVISLVSECIEISKTDWDSNETSWDFRRHPLLLQVGTIEEAYSNWEKICIERFNILKCNEEKINSIFIQAYGLKDELEPSVEDKYITVKKADLKRDIQSLISFAVGCMFGRYSLNTEGVVYAGGEWNPSRYSSYAPDSDNCIPITDEAYFEDDIVGRFVEFVRVAYGSDYLEENLNFIAKAIGGKGNSSRDIIRSYFLNDFFIDHCTNYSVTGSGKRPIYWLFDSGKQNGFKALTYMHRWDADTIGNLRVEYLHRIQRVYEKEVVRMQDIIDNSRDNREINQATKRREKLVKQLKEARDYDAKIAHAALSRVEIDLDDGVKFNYEKVQKGPDGKNLGILAKI